MALELVDISDEVSVNPEDVSAVIRYGADVFVVLRSSDEKHHVPPLDRETGQDTKARVKTSLTNPLA